VRERVLTALAILPIVLLPLASAYFWPAFLLAILIAFLGHREISRMMTGEVRPGPVIGILLLVAALGLYAFRRQTFVDALYPPAYFVAWLALIGIGPLFVNRQPRERNPMLKSEVASVVWVVIPLMALLWLHQVPEITEPFNLHNPIWLAMIPVWCGDIAAILVGRAVGRHPLAPTISPKKTWEGAIANLATAVLVAWILGPFVQVTTEAALASGVAVGILGQIGDLYESYIKRQAGVKDSGSLLPGHGGIMDRIDSMVFAAPAVAVIVYWLK